MRVGKYELGRTLGEGNSAKVKLATDTVSGQSFAVKIIDKSRTSRLNVPFQIKREIRTLKVLKHPNIVRLHEEDGLLHTTCGSPNYVTPEVLANKGYDGAASDIWSCGVILHDYSPSSCDAEDESSSAEEDVSEEEKSHDSSTVINAFQLIGMSPFLDLSGLFETETVSERQIRFMSNRLATDVM
ncbi:hypothetical protein Bca52824_074626 [Brassica carinata]|uniref:non-specific serine/threonine protein kinase n=1 Tax=Brassica carinata TaxID=52824 RepID=A0A8X7TUX7_BRACI|nr:hypothetical protein Bca52824_074626 [Brassica carinata]